MPDFYCLKTVHCGFVGEAAKPNVFMLLKDHNLTVIWHLNKYVEIVHPSQKLFYFYLALRSLQNPYSNLSN